MKCIHCNNDIEIIIYDKNKFSPKLMIQVKKVIKCPECGADNEIDISFGMDACVKLKSIVC